MATDKKDGPSLGGISAAGSMNAPREDDITFFHRMREIIEAVGTNPQSESPDELWRQMFTGPAPLASRIGIIPYNGVLRLSFGEQYDEHSPTQFRAAVTLTDYSAWELYHLLSQNPAVQYWDKQYQQSLKVAEKEASDANKGD